MECPPKEPVELSMLGIYSEAPKIERIVQELSTHILYCLRHRGNSSCDNKICSYFRWFYPHHYNQCSLNHHSCFQTSKPGSSCGSCRKLQSWLTQHSATCSQDCPIIPCQTVYKHEIMRSQFRDLNHCIGSVSHDQPPLSHDPPAPTMRDTRGSSITSSISITSNDLFRSNQTTGEFAESAEYGYSMDPRKNMPVDFIKSSSLTRELSLQIPRSDTISEYLREDEIVEINPEESLPPSSTHLPRPLNEGVVQMSIQRQMTEEERKAVYGRNSISLPRTVPEDESHEISQGSHELARGSHDISQGSHELAWRSHDIGSRSPRRSEELTKQRKQQFIKNPNFCESPEVQRSTTHQSSSEYSSLEEAKPHSQFYLRDGESTSSDYDSSTGPSSLEEVHDKPTSLESKGRQGRVFQREDSDLEGGHTKLLLGSSGSITTAHYNHIRAIQNDIVKFRLKKEQFTESGNRKSDTSGIASETPSNSSLTSEQEQDDAYSSLDDPSGILEILHNQENYETEGSATSTIIGNSLDTGSSNSLIHAPEFVSPDRSHDQDHSQPMSFIPYLSHEQKPRSHDHDERSRLKSSSPETESENYYSESESNESSGEEQSLDPHCIARSPVQPYFSLKQNLETVDQVFEQYKDDIHIMNHRPRRGGKIPTHVTASMSEADKQKLQPTDLPSMDPECDFDPGLPSNADPELVAKQHELHRQMVLEKFPEDEEIIRRGIMARRDQLKQYLIGQFYSDQVYREHVNWRRRTKLGNGAQAACYSVTDNNTHCILVLKEEIETQKALDEAYVSLKFACQSNPSPNIVEYYTAALLPSNMLLPPGHTPFVQIFMEQMPTSLQDWLFKCGPISLHNVHHYACQLFDALDFLHNRQGIIHCDIKPANILIDDTAQRIKLTDFGSAELLEVKRPDERKIFSAARNAGTLNYNPPEFYRNNLCGFGFDVWQAGCCVLAMATGRRPWRHLYMDVYPEQSQQHIAHLMKRQNIEKIKQQHNGHLLPAFLDHTLQKLLYGCLHDNPAQRLTAKECNYLLNIETASSEMDRMTIHSAISDGYSTASPSVLKDFQVDQSKVDVYLGSSKICQVPLSDHMTPGQSHMTCRMALNAGWIGSIKCHHGMTYREAELKIRQCFPVTQQLGMLIPCCYGNNPQAIWSASSNQTGLLPTYRHVTLDSQVDTINAIILIPSSAV